MNRTNKIENAILISKRDLQAPLQIPLLMGVLVSVNLADLEFVSVLEIVFFRTALRTFAMRIADDIQFIAFTASALGFSEIDHELRVC